jgi:hypothetical protein
MNEPGPAYKMDASRFEGEALLLQLRLILLQEAKVRQKLHQVVAFRERLESQLKKAAGKL